MGIECIRRRAGLATRPWAPSCRSADGSNDLDRRQRARMVLEVAAAEGHDGKGPGGDGDSIGDALAADSTCATVVRQVADGEQAAGEEHRRDQARAATRRSTHNPAAANSFTSPPPSQPPAKGAVPSARMTRNSSAFCHSVARAPRRPRRLWRRRGRRAPSRWRCAGEPRLRLPRQRAQGPGQREARRSAGEQVQFTLIASRLLEARAYRHRWHEAPG